MLDIDTGKPDIEDIEHFLSDEVNTKDIDTEEDD